MTNEQKQAILTQATVVKEEAAKLFQLVEATEVPAEPETPATPETPANEENTAQDATPETPANPEGGEAQPAADEANGGEQPQA